MVSGIVPRPMLAELPTYLAPPPPIVEGL